ncbi:carbohydrate sulfotransferase 11-like [Ylistrum balloti]|uniref:carbohydrate sulfotransferase 11-like n=1 Tax=Ylistrum balloti TaxID=509963 RepID=UPI002905CBF8|nr:carbohydrate sulfotransferase 11-like [Ylistrum balloti]
MALHQPVEVKLTLWCRGQDHYPQFFSSANINEEKSYLIEDKKKMVNSFGFKDSHDKRIKNRFEARRFNISEVCQAGEVYQVLPKLVSIKDRNFLYDSKHNFIYCMVEKIGSTFWRRVFHLLYHPQYSNLYSIPHHHIHNDLLPTLRNFTIENSLKIIQTSKKAMFVREPYARAFSGFVDKLYSLNYYYMHSLGRGIIKALRKNATQASLACGHDMTFVEFIKYLVIMKQRKLQNNVDVHFSQIYTHCLPCEMKYDFVGTMENFDEDASYIISRSQLFQNTSFELSKNASVTLSIYHVLNETFSLRNKMAHCMTWEAMYTRAWRTLQIRGLISPDAPVPTATNVTMDLLYREAVKVSDPSRVSEYKHKSMIDIYRTVSKPLLEKFREYVLPDCKLFGYDDRPSYLFDRT